MAESGQVRAKQEAFITVFLSTKSIMEAAKKAGVSDRTARRWLQEPAMQEALRTARTDIYQQSLQDLKKATQFAVALLVACLQENEASMSVRVRAAETILRHAIEIHSLQELEARIAELEALIKVRSA